MICKVLMRKITHQFQGLAGNKFFVVLLLLAIIPAVFKLIRPGFYPMYDDMQVIRVQQMDVCIKDGQVPCRWVPDLGLGYGYPLYQYYAPLPYYFMEAIHLVGFSYINSVKLGFMFSIIFASLAFYAFARHFFSKEASFLVAFLYIYAPFRAQDLYVRGAMGELWGTVSVPFLLYGFEKLIKEKNRGAFLVFSISVFIFFISHNLTVLIFLPFIILWMLLRMFMLKRGGEINVKLAFSAFVGIGLAAFYIIPLIFEKNLVHIETLTSGYFGYLQHFLSIKQIFLAMNWGYGPSVLGSGDDAFLGIGPIHTLLAASGFFAAVIAYKKKLNKLILPITLFVLFLGYAFLSHQRSTFIWKAVGMDILQFPWRFVMACVFIASVLAGYFVDVFVGKLRIAVVFLVVTVTLLLYGGFFQPKGWIEITDNEKLSGELLKKQLTASIYDYLPKSAIRAPDDIASEELVIIEGNVETKSLDKGSNWFEYYIDVKTDSAEVAIPSYDFPEWKVYLNGSETETGRFGDFGLVSFEVQKGESSINAQLTRSLPRKIGDSVSAIAVVFIGFVLFGSSKLWKSYSKK